MAFKFSHELSYFSHYHSQLHFHPGHCLPQNSGERSLLCPPPPCGPGAQGWCRWESLHWIPTEMTKIHAHILWTWKSGSGLTVSTWQTLVLAFILLLKININIYEYLDTIYMYVVTQSCPTLCDAMDCSPPGSSVHGIFKARILVWITIPFSRGPSWPRDWNCITGRFFIFWATRKALNVYIYIQLNKYIYFIIYI